MRVRDTAARAARMAEYCERRRAELVAAGATVAELAGLRAGALSDLVITMRRRRRPRPGPLRPIEAQNGSRR